MKNVFYYETSLGRLGIEDNGFAVIRLGFQMEKFGKNAELCETELIKTTFNQLEEYFRGERKVFDVTLAPEGTTFQKKVWAALRQIPYGETRTYGQVAADIGNPKACRAVGMANNRNPIGIIIPCHRVIGSNGRLVGYAGGVGIKEQLLKIEGAL
ncbi:methylated-DNA--[protein]-cysteine S-methyltransferase [Eubacterium sp. 1001713B170207_170306_E7]|uniref:methylated-DNA--[protein]-cysteine S-methyltransferase n=1 Tax=Eubacterium sp. 1001713B170207_170306_E7 TaxID=2787097 RepID=UPI00189C2E08|nr:methylated-DNA--[protein]-cysteine S-methyltransferase [Eubacterium sp. 1001713B170207_170306_E7]